MRSGFGIRGSGFDRSPDPVRLLRHWRKVFWLSVGLVLMASADVLVATYGPASRAATVETGASFSVSAGSFATEPKAAAFAAALDASGLPVFVRARVEDGRYQVLVGPYVSTDEAERAQRRLAAWGLGEARLVVDDAMRARPQEAAIFGFGEGTSNSVVMIAAGSMSSLVFEMQERPKSVELRRTGVTAIEVEIEQGEEQGEGGRGKGEGGRGKGKEERGKGEGGQGKGKKGVLESLALPDGVVLVQQLSVHSEGDSLRAHLVVPDGVENRLRLEGHRVYLDLAFPKAPWSVRRAPQAAPAPVKTVASEPPRDDREQLDAAVARFDQIKPFLTSAIQAPEPEVLAALAHSLDDVRTTVERLNVNGDAETDRASLLAAIADASDAIKKAGDLSISRP